MKNGQARSISILKILEAIGDDDQSLNLFNMIATKGGTSDNLLDQLGISRKQYYSRVSRLLNSGLVKRECGSYVLTYFGKVIHEAHLKLTEAVNNSCVKKNYVSSINEIAGMNKS